MLQEIQRVEEIRSKMKTGTIYNFRQKANLVGNRNTNIENKEENYNEDRESEGFSSSIQRACDDGVELNVQKIFNPEGENECTLELEDDFIASTVLN